MNCSPIGKFYTVYSIVDIIYLIDWNNWNLIDYEDYGDLNHLINDIAILLHLTISTSADFDQGRRVGGPRGTLQDEDAGHDRPRGGAAGMTLFSHWNVDS